MLNRKFAGLLILLLVCDQFILVQSRSAAMELDAALSDFDRAVRLMPKNAEVHCNRGFGAAQERSNRGRPRRF